MSINMELMRKKLAQLRGEDKGDGNSVWFKPDEGDKLFGLCQPQMETPLRNVFPL